MKLKDNEQLKGKVGASSARSIYDDLLDAQKDPNIVHVHVCANLQGDYAVKVLRSDASGGFYHSGGTADDDESRAWRDYAEKYNFKLPGEEYIYTPEAGSLNLGCTGRRELVDGSFEGLPRLDVPGKYGEYLIIFILSLVNACCKLILNVEFDK